VERGAERGSGGAGDGYDYDDAPDRSLPLTGLHWPLVSGDRRGR
jgi:hypothetical protein